MYPTQLPKSPDPEIQKPYILVTIATELLENPALIIKHTIWQTDTNH